MTSLILLPLYILFHIHAFILIFKWMGACKKPLNKITVRMLVGVIYAILFLSLPAGVLLPVGGLKRFLMTIGNFALGITIYEIVPVIIADILAIISKKRKRKKEAKKPDVKEELTRENPEETEKEVETENDIKDNEEKKSSGYMGVLLAALILALCIIGFINARIIRSTEYQIEIDKKVEWMKELNLVMVGDLHLGYNTGSRQMKKMVKKINAQNPDIVIIAGDIFDSDYDALSDPDELIDILKGIDSRYGVYAVYGEDDSQKKRLSDLSLKKDKDKAADERMDSFLKDADIKVLKDEYILIDNKFYLYGRPDAGKALKSAEKRKTADEIVKGMNMSKPVIVIDHKPKELDKLAQAGVDLDLSGHTLNGQIWPYSLITKLFWDNSYGYSKLGDMHSIVTSGVGVYGPNIRLGTKAEICHIEIKMGN